MGNWYDDNNEFAPWELKKEINEIIYNSKTKESKMSTKSTLILTTDNEHFYKESNAPYFEDTKTEYCFVIEVDKKHKVETDEDGTRIIIEENTPLFNDLSFLLHG